MTYDPQKHHRRSVRLAGHDYAGAAWYFVTICAARRGDVFGRIVDEKFQANKFGRIVEECCLSLPEHFPHIVLDEFIVMPDHLHAILVFTHDMQHNVNADVRLGDVVGSFKAAVTRHINDSRGQKTVVWQRSFWEHVIRDERDSTNTRRYINENPMRWTNRKLRDA